MKNLFLVLAVLGTLIFNIWGLFTIVPIVYKLAKSQTSVNVLVFRDKKLGSEISYDYPHLIDYPNDEIQFQGSSFAIAKGAKVNVNKDSVDFQKGIFYFKSYNDLMLNIGNMSFTSKNGFSGLIDSTNKKIIILNGELMEKTTTYSQYKILSIISDRVSVKDSTLKLVEADPLALSIKKVAGDMNLEIEELKLINAETNSSSSSSSKVNSGDN